MNRHRAIGALVATGTLLMACASVPRTATSPADPRLSQCLSNDTIYTLSDSSRGVVGASPTRIVLPTPPVDHGAVELRLLIGTDGRVIAESTLVLSSAGSQNDDSARRIMAKSTFRPAVRNGCPVRFWYQITFRSPGL